jgi:hypothetical protein
MLATPWVWTGVLHEGGAFVKRRFADGTSGTGGVAARR